MKSPTAFGSRRGALGLAAGFASVGVVSGALAGPDLADVTDPVQGVRLLALTALYVTVAVVALRRARRGTDEREIWTRVALGTVVLAVLTSVGALLGLTGTTDELAGAALGWAPVLAFPFFYGGLVNWNRFRTNLADPSDLLNGASAVFAVLAIGNVVVDASGGALDQLPAIRLQALLAQGSTDFVLFGTALSVVFIGAMTRDARSWLVVAAAAVPLVGAATSLAAGGEPTVVSTAVQPLGVLLFCVAAALRPGRITPQPADPTQSTVGAFVVIVSSTAVLVLGAATGSAVAGTWCAALAAAGSSLQLLFNVRQLAQLAVSRREALTDELTELANRRAVLRRVEELCAGGVPLVLGLLDLDKFKEVNDGLGHTMGDELLRLVARRLEPVLRPGDLLGRLGGDEFAVVTAVDHGVPADAVAAALGARLRERLDEPFHLGGLLVHATASIGLTSADGAGTAAQLMRQADAAMYDAKRSGRDVVVFDPARHVDRSGHLALVEELRAGLATGQLELHHQPQVDVVTGRTVGVEALVRWQHPVRGLLGPGDFLPLAEVHGLMGVVTEEVLRQAVVQLADWRRRGLDLRVSVNLSASNLLDTSLPDRVAGLLRAHAVPADALVLEVTESVLLSDPDRSLAVVGALADLGATVSIDDFGTGYSSLAYLRELPVGELKLDRSFTADLLTDNRTEAIVASTIDLAHRLGLRVVAEGVEQAATEAHLRALGCDETQGYLHARPLPADRLEAWLDAQLVS